MTKKQSTYEKSVKPFYHISKEFHHGSNKCNIIYSPDRILSSKSQFYIAEAKQVKNKFGFKLLCDDLLQSVREAENFRFKQDITQSFPKNLIEKGIKSYGVETNTRDLFVVHKISAKIGFAISTYSALKEGMIVAEYVGERKPSDIKISDTTYLALNDDGTNTDAKDYGNVARFFHHCPHEHTDKQVMTANLVMMPWKVSETLTKMFFMTTRDIKAFEPLCWDYGDKYAFDHEVELLNAETYVPITEFQSEL